MDFIDQIKQFSQRIDGLIGDIQTEEATKTSLVMPFFSLLGYDVFNPNEFVPEFTADVGIKKGEKVDYAIFLNGSPTILVEAKWVGAKLEKHDSQLFRYFGTTNAKFAILTNGRFYKFYTDLEEPNKMDEKPFLEIDLLNIKDSQVAELKKFTKTSFDISTIFDTASDLKYSNVFKSTLKNELESPSDDFVKFFLRTSYDGVKTQSVIDKFRPVLKKSLNNYVTELMNERISSALETHSKGEEVASEIEEEEAEEVAPRIITTEKEIESFYIVKSILFGLVEPERITYKDNERYFSVLFDGSVRKQICRLNLDSRKKLLMVPDKEKNFIKYQINGINDIYSYKQELINVLNMYLSLPQND